MKIFLANFFLNKVVRYNLTYLFGNKFLFTLIFSRVHFDPGTTSLPGHGGAIMKGAPVVSTYEVMLTFYYQNSRTINDPHPDSSINKQKNKEKP